VNRDNVTHRIIKVLKRFFKKAFWFYEEPSTTEKTCWKWCLKEQLKVPLDTFIGSFQDSLRKWFFREPWAEMFSVEPEMVPSRTIF